MRRRAVTVALLASAVTLVAGPSAVAAQPGAIFTKTAGCSENGTVTKFASKQDVFVSGTNLPEGTYYLNVTGPSGNSLNVDEPGGTVTVGADGSLGCTNVYGVTPFDDTTNHGGVYSVSISHNVTGKGPKQKNFKLAEGNVPPQQTEVKVEKFYDANADGLHNSGESLISGWEVSATDGTDTYNGDTTWTIFLDDGPWTISEGTPNEANWFATTPTSVPIDVPDDNYVSFGNVCIGGGGGGLTLGFWSNKNGQALVGTDDMNLLRVLNLRNANGTPFDPAGYAAFRTWLLSANSTNMAYMLSAQMAAMALNVHNNKVSGSALIYAPDTDSANGAGFASVNDVIAEADASLGAHENTTAAGPVRTGQEALKNALDRANNNLNFVQGQPCAFSFAP